MGYKKTRTLDELSRARANIGIRCLCGHRREITIREFSQATGIKSGVWETAARRFICGICGRRGPVLFPC